jgi:hypothetical protein
MNVAVSRGAIWQNPVRSYATRRVGRRVNDCLLTLLGNTRRANKETMYENSKNNCRS